MGGRRRSKWSSSTEHKREPGDVRHLRPPPLESPAVRTDGRFELRTELEPCGDQPRAIDALARGVEAGEDAQVLLGVTGSGKTFTMANVIARVQRPALVIAHNKTLAAQLFGELRELFPANAVEYFVSYYDYYQPEAYIPKTDTYIEKEATQNDRLDRLRHGATRSLLTRRDVVIVASVSCIYGLGSPESYFGMKVALAVGQRIARDDVLRQLAVIQYQRNDLDLRRGTFRVRGDVIDIHPAHEDARAVRVEMFGDEVERITAVDPLTGEVKGELASVEVFPKSHYVTPEAMLERAIEGIESELETRLPELHRKGKLVEAQRLEQRARYDLEMLREAGTCAGIENYSRHLTGREPGQPPPTLLDYFPDDALIFIDESHQTVPQLVGMYRGDRARKETLVDFGFRLPSALDNRPLRFDEFEGFHRQIVFVSATPAAYELGRARGRVVEQVVRPTGLIDPAIEVRPTIDQVHDLRREVERAAKLGQRVLVTTLTKRMAEDLTEFYLDEGLKVKYLHSDIDTIERSEIIRALREGEFDCLVGINLLREGLDIPEVALVAVLDADKEGFLRNETSLIQTCGRAARNVEGRVIFYADQRTRSIQAALAETERRRKLQAEHNAAHGITPKGIQKKAAASLAAFARDDYVDLDRLAPPGVSEEDRRATAAELPERIAALRAEMLEAAQALDYERAAELRDRVLALEQLLIVK